MTRYLMRLVLIASALFFIFPMIPGTQFHGNFLHALGAGILFAFLGWIVESLAIALSAILTIGTLGLALLILIPAWILGFFLLPALVLRYVADFMPATLSFTGWTPAFWGGLIMLCIGIATSGKDHERIRSTRVTTKTTIIDD
ncbi:MAG: phage holin family protein [Candidatus Obscuribacterales bacterium]|nr:phage holin family protein [Candidatus Obscuribacterales bacterium]